MGSNFRIHLLFSFFVLFAAALVARLYFVQIIHGEYYAERGENQYVTPSDNVFNRGSIFFTEKDGDLVSAATQRSGFALFINPGILKDPEHAYSQISKIIPLDRESYFIKARKKNDPYEEIARNIGREDTEAILSLALTGVGVRKDKWRFYPAGSSTAHVLGFVGFDGSDLSGRYGLERYYNDELMREDGGPAINFFAEVFLSLRDAVFQKDAEREGDLALTIEPFVQSFLEDELLSLHRKYSPRESGGIIMDPRSGAIYALSSLPTFDPNNYSSVPDQAVFTNPLIENVYEMGSIVKPLTMAAALDTGSVTSETTYYDAGYLTLNSSRIENYDGKGRGTVDMQEVLNQSLNTGVVFAMQKMGKDTFRRYMLRFGIDEETGIDLPGEVHGLADNLESSRDIEFATASYGQGIATTPIAITRALASLGNGGMLVTPYLVKEIRGTNGLKKSIQPLPGVRVIQEETSEEITRMLVNVVDKALLGGTVKLPHYAIAAKTGTASMADPVNGGYYKDRNLHSFFGYFPAYDPHFIVFLYAVHPKGVRYSSETLTEPFMNIAKFLLNYYEIPPDR